MTDTETIQEDKAERRPEVSVIMPVYNTEKYLAEAIESILRQTFTDFELIIVDDHSTNDTKTIIEAYQQRDPRIRTIYLNSNKGSPHARNRGLDIAVGKYIANMDSDDISLPTRLEKQLNFLKQNPDIGAVGVRSRKANHDLSISNEIRLCPEEHPLIVLHIFTGDSLTFLEGTLMFRRQFLYANGGWNDHLWHNFQKRFFVSLISNTAIRFANIPEVLYIHRSHETNQSHSPTHTAHRRALTETRRELELLFGRVSDDTIRRFKTLRQNEELSRTDRRAAQKDFRRIIDAVVRRGYIRPDERHILIDAVDIRFEKHLPRRWQMLRHWYRYRIKRHFKTKP